MPGIVLNGGNTDEQSSPPQNLMGTAKAAAADKNGRSCDRCRREHLNETRLSRKTPGTAEA